MCRFGVLQVAIHNKLDQCLPGNAKARGFLVHRVHHPGREIHINALQFTSGAAGPTEIKVRGNIFTVVKAAVKLLRWNRNRFKGELR